MKQPQKPPRSSRKRRKPTQTPPQTKRKTTVYQRIAQQFIACHRCDHFFSSYRTQVGEETLHQQIDALQNNWLTLSLTDGIRRGVAGVFGWQISADTIHFEGRCSECGRRVVLEMDGENLLYVQANPEIVAAS